MRIGFFTNTYLPATGGIITVLENYEKEMEKRGHDVFIFAAGHRDYQDKDPRVFRFRSIDLHYKVSYPLPIISSRRISKIIKELKLDIIHSQHFFICGQIAWYYAQKFNIPLVFTQHTRYDFYTHYVPYLPKEISIPLAEILCVFYADTSDVVIAPTQDIKESLLKYKVKKPIFVIPSGIYLEKFSEMNNQAIRRKYNISENKLLLLTVSRLNPEKNISFLLKSFRKIILKYPNTYFMIVGDGPSRKELELQATKLGIRKKIIFTGNIHQDKIPFYYNTADIFLFSSFTETQGIVIAEAMAASLPVVAIEANGVKDVIINKENGFLTSDNIDDFSQTVIKLIDNPDLRKNISKKARKTAKKFSIEHTTQKILNLYEKAIIQKKEGYKSQNKSFNLLKNKFINFKFNQIFDQK